MQVRARIIRLLILNIFVFGCFLVSSAQDTAKLYLQRAENLYARINQLYRVAGNTGLFTENFPSNHSDTLTYFQGSGVKEKAVSFLWPFSGMFSATNTLLKIRSIRRKYLPFLDSLIVGVEKYHDTTRNPPGYQAYPVMFEKVDRYYDDNGLVGIDYMESYFNTQNPIFLRRAESVFKFIISGWNHDLGGGVTWLEGHKDQKPACSNGTAMLVALKIYQGTRNPYYLNWGKKFYHWMYQNLRDPVTGVISNDKKLDGSVNNTFWTYNTGFMLESAVLLYKFSGDKNYLSQAQGLARASYQYFGKKTNDGHLSLLDMPWFLTVLFRGYQALYNVDGNPKYINAVMQNVNDAWKRQDQYGLINKDWYGKDENSSKPKWLLDEACMVEFYARMAIIKGKTHLK